MRLTASTLRQNIYRVLDAIIASGEPVEIERRGRRLRISLVEDHGAPTTAPRDLDALTARPGALRGNPLDIVHLDWSTEWRP